MEIRIYQTVKAAPRFSVGCKPFKIGQHGQKSEQSREIARAIAYLNDWKERGKP